jgi:hypothetical protein
MNQGQTEFGLNRKTPYNSTFTIGGVSCSADTFVVNQSLVLLNNTFSTC